jgi:hypothetical protein
MAFSLKNFRNTDNRALVAGLLLCAFLLRAMIPAGAMPDPKALEEGVFQVTICTGSGPAELLVGPDGQPVDSHPPGKGDVCPYSIGSVAAFPAPAIPSFTVQAFAVGSPRAARRSSRIKTFHKFPQLNGMSAWCAHAFRRFPCSYAFCLRLRLYFPHPRLSPMPAAAEETRKAPGRS